MPHEAGLVDHLDRVGHRQARHRGQVTLKNRRDDPIEDLDRGEATGRVMHQHDRHLRAQRREPGAHRLRALPPAGHHGDGCGRGPGGGILRRERLDIRARDDEDDLDDDIDDLDAADFDEDGSPILHAGDVDGVDIDELDNAIIGGL